LVVFSPVLEGSDATAGFCFAGGKAKPLKAPKVDKKEYDEVCCYALDFVHVSLLDFFVAPNSDLLL
jgi:hypothetical protein